jgi:hypothetical protein
MAWANIEVCDICRDPAGYKKALPIGRPSFGTRVCPACARHSSIGIVDDGSWRFYLYDNNTGVASAQLDSVAKSAGPTAKSAAMASHSARLLEIAGTSR